MDIPRFLAIRRNDIFSPNSVQKDRMILQAVCQRLQDRLLLDSDIEMIDESEFAGHPVEASCYITMARSDEALTALHDMERKGRRAINCAESVRSCQRSVLDRMMREHHISMPETDGVHGYWLKRGDASAQSKADVVFCNDHEQLEMAQREFENRGIHDMVVSAHVPGDLLKFYGVGTRMFRVFYPNDDGISKFGDEERNGKAHHYDYDAEALRAEVEKVALLTGTEVYGGDAIVAEDGRFYIIDFNDWPSFSRCLEEATLAIAEQILNT